MESIRKLAYKRTLDAIRRFKQTGSYTSLTNNKEGATNMSTSNLQATMQQNQLIITKQMVRDRLYFSGPISVSSLTHSLVPNGTTISMGVYNKVMAYILELEQESKVKYNFDNGCYEALYVVK